MATREGDTMKATIGRPGARNLSALIAGAALAVAASACDVTNPGQILDDDLNNPEAFPALVNGMASDFSQALAGHCCNAGPATDALFGGFFGGTSGRGNIWFASRFGALPPDQPERSNDLVDIHQARWVAEDGIARMQEVLGEGFNSSALAAEANLWAGFSNRLGGDTFCSAVFNGGGFQPRSAWYERAEPQFTRAIEIARNAGDQRLEYAGYAGRASVRIQLGDWEGAVSDAGQVPTDFVFAADFGSTAQGDRRTNSYWKEMSDRVNFTLAFTWFRDYYEETGDPRVPSVDGREGRLAGDGESPVVKQRKYPTGGSDIPVAKGTEMRLIEAEYHITQTGDWQMGMQIINDLRADAGVAPWQADNQEEAFEALVKERAIVTWLEGRRGGDYYRWEDFQASEDPIITTMVANARSTWPNVTAQNRDRCYQISETTREANPNLPATGGGP